VWRHLRSAAIDLVALHDDPDRGLIPRLGVATCASPCFPNLGPIFRAGIRSAITAEPFLYRLALRAKLIGFRYSHVPGLLRPKRHHWRRIRKVVEFSSFP
jgi:hypothetical protein